MAKYVAEAGEVDRAVDLDRVFGALADPTRRAVVRRLGRGSASVTELAEPFGMALPSFLKHVQVLERSGCIATRKVGRTRVCTLEPRVVVVAEDWLRRERADWEARTDRLEHFVLGELAELGQGQASDASADREDTP
ncbi:metalloregulator ArsR/SmtB family transcription factor [Herbiconiux moechotypicola]|uniref:HTH arsR-type domain-containing protein n=1 Tax=Herbiconiux moechotypicola TaxID=637393 RepID=A0ABN3DNN0_9MICO|nr:metalloregulator ArsR/SmtB family transcription factor [Herbiconiux moechotypicola]MCS5730391.1 metalloregulator ArsR/SmtB family transcription factor [Herbiconiux moechotypicola]